MTSKNRTLLLIIYRLMFM